MEKKQNGFTSMTGANYGNKGGGRPKDKIVNACKKMTSSPKALKFLRAVINGEPVEPKLLWSEEKRKMETIWMPADVETRTKVWEKVANRGWGTPVQQIEVGLDASRMLLVRTIEAEVLPSPGERAA